MTDDPRIKFNKYFSVKKGDLDKEGFFNISLISDLPLFIDPFHLFYNTNKDYQKLHKGIIDLVKLVELCSTNPAKIFRLKERGTLRVGSIADVTIIDPTLEWTYKNSNSKSKSENSPFDNWNFTGAAVATIVGGKIVYRREK